MLDLAALDWGRLRQPSPLFRAFTSPTEEQVASIVGRLRENYLYAPDEIRDEATLRALVGAYWGGANIVYEIGEFRGLMGFMDIIPEHKASVTLKLWDKGAWGRNFVREARALCALVMDEFRLTRLSTETADKERIVPVAKMAGFTIEGCRPKDFKWNGEHYDTWLMGLVRE